MDNLNDHDPITVIEFCAGYGGLGLGIKGVLGERMRLIGLCELEGFAQANLISKMEAGLMEQVPIWSNLLTFPYRKFRGLVDIAAAGIPCQPHSLAGKRSGGGDQRFLFDDWLCGLEQMQPKAIFIENVEGFLSSKMPDGTLCVEWTIKRLEAMGYQTATGIFSAREVGAPHQRKRVFILAHRIDQGSQGWVRGREDSERKDQHGRTGCGSTGVHRWWPSRPGQPQHGWEPPRVVGNAEYDGSHQCSEEARGTKSGGEQGRVQKLEGGGTSMGDTSTDATDGCELANTSSQGCDWRPLQDRTGQWSVSQLPQPYRGKSSGIRNEFERCGESDGVVGNAEGGMPRQSSAGDWREGAGEAGEASEAEWQVEPSLGGDSDGSTRGMGYAELCVSCDNRTNSGTTSECGGELADSINDGCDNANSRPIEHGVEGSLGKETTQQTRRDRIHSTEHWQAIGDGQLHSDLYTSCDNRTDELRLLGNGVVPATATLAFQTLLAELLTL